MKQPLSSRLLIVNADDANLTPGVTQAILECHDHGIVSSTTWMANVELKNEWLRAVLKRKRLGVGIHLNITFGFPVSAKRNVYSLLDDEDRFLKPLKLLSIKPKALQILTEYEAQIRLFRKQFSRLPTHLDTHHQLHDYPFYWRILKILAKKYRLPVRRSCLIRRGEKNKAVRWSDHFFGDLSVSGYWRKSVFRQVLSKLPEGVSEMMCHPGFVDRDLQKVSSFTTGREKEYEIFASPEWKNFLLRRSIELTHYGMLY